ncbi:SAVED domain-containing protein [Citrobacter sp. TBCS-14]|uniref:SAVED domain-containing protein n=1 Tax=Citrobacter sp. TBCS-14 TaxID=2576409 RepID=UPI00164A0841|nr:SAVED domain-containing protein [Citrobacter sp. TBCS-14]
MTSVNESILNLANQALLPPLDTSENVESYFEFINTNIQWNDVIVLSDDNHQNTLILLLKNKLIVCAMRFNLEQSEFVTVIQRLCRNGKDLKLAVLQGNVLSEADIAEFTSLQNVLVKCCFQTIKVTLTEIKKFLASIGKPGAKGRGPRFTKDTKEAIWKDSHGRCMFTGCGLRLGIDELSGERGNFSYLAHNVASSENGERGIPVLSDKLSNETSNVLLLCDKHHRLVDKIAGCNYPASRLSDMRVQHCQLSEILLDGLSYEPVDVYVLLWPVNTQVVSPPGSRDIAGSLATMKLRSLCSPNVLDNGGENVFQRVEATDGLLPAIIESSARRILDQTRRHDFKAALFVFGPMPALVGLGALLGNKGQFLPMLRYRDGGCWMWPTEEPVSKFYSVEGKDTLVDHEDLVISINFTAISKTVENKTQELKYRLGCGVISYTADPEFMGNGAIPHPVNGIAFCAQLQQDMHDFRLKYGVKRVHLLICASNAASVFVGQAYDLHHPDMIVYDFEGDRMKPVLLISNKPDGTKLLSPEC